MVGTLQKPNYKPWGAYRPGIVGRTLIALSRNTVLGRGASRTAIDNWFSRLHDGPVDTSLFGAPMRLFPQSNGTERRVLFRPNRYDTEELRFLRNAIKSDESIFVDIGSNAGIYSLYAASHAGHGSRIVAIDPNKDLLARLRFNESLWRVQSCILPSVSVETCEVAISDTDGTGNLLADTKEGSRGLGASGDLVETRTLCRLLRDLAISRIDILKIDIEGHEDRALIPFLLNAPVRLLPSRIIIEHISCRRWSEDCFVSLADKGYHAVGKTRLNTLLQKVD